jgi:hypothetical protein
MISSVHLSLLFLLLTSVAAEFSVLQLRIRKVPGLNLGDNLVCIV